MTCLAPCAVAILPTYGLHAVQGHMGPALREKPTFCRHPACMLQGAPRGGGTVGILGKETIFSTKLCFLQGKAKDFYLCCFALSLVVPNLLQAENMILGSGKLLVQGW